MPIRFSRDAEEKIQAFVKKAPGARIHHEILETIETLARSPTLGRADERLGGTFIFQFRIVRNPLIYGVSVAMSGDGERRARVSGFETSWIGSSTKKASSRMAKIVDLGEVEAAANTRAATVSAKERRPARHRVCQTPAEVRP